MSREGLTTNLPPTAHKSPSSDALQSERLSEDTTEKVSKTKTENVTPETSDANVLWVDWDGPEDPMNPKKWVVRLLSIQFPLT